MGLIVIAYVQVAMHLLSLRTMEKIRKHHFSHASGNDCGTGYQTMVHLLAKDIIEESKIFPFLLRGKYLRASEVYKEFSLVKELGITPDIYGFVHILDGTNIVGKIPFIVEIYVTHKVDDEKAAIIRRAKIPAVEIDLSKVEISTKEELTREIYNPKNWNIIYGEIGEQYLPKRQVSPSGGVRTQRRQCTSLSYFPFPISFYPTGCYYGRKNNRNSVKKNYQRRSYRKKR